jgi:hypothetical protein
MSEEVLRQIQERINNAAPGPWISFVEGRDHSSGSNFIKVKNGEHDDIELIGASTDDQDFIAHAREDMPRLLEEVRRLQHILKQHGIDYEN